jgi:hypothetical protein
LILLEDLKQSPFALAAFFGPVHENEDVATEQEKETKRLDLEIGAKLAEAKSQVEQRNKQRELERQKKIEAENEFLDA